MITCRHLLAVSVKPTLYYVVYRILEQVGFVVKLHQKMWIWQAVQNQELYCQKSLQEELLPWFKQTESLMQGSQMWKRCLIIIKI